MFLQGYGERRWARGTLMMARFLGFAIVAGVATVRFRDFWSKRRCRNGGMVRVEALRLGEGREKVEN